MGQMKKRPTNGEIKTPRTPQMIGGPLKKPEDAKKEKRERKNKEPKRPETVDVSWRLYAPPKVIE